MRFLILLLVAGAGLLPGQQPRLRRSTPLGYDDTPVLPGQKWRVHDIARPRPPQVMPGQNGSAPSDAVVLFDGQDLSHWVEHGGRNERGKVFQPRWNIVEGAMQVVPGTGSLVSKEKFGDCQVHVEWAVPSEIDSSGQHRGNSGVLLMGRYEIQILDSWDNPTYADGQAASIYGQYPPLANSSRKPGEWQSFDIVFEAPRFQNGKLVRPAYVTVFHNGVLVHHHQEIIGPMAHRIVRPYEPHDPEEPLALQNHDEPVKFRNIWVRRLKRYDASF